jgi:hypothetical protein
MKIVVALAFLAGCAQAPASTPEPTADPTARPTTQPFAAELCELLPLLDEPWDHAALTEAQEHLAGNVLKPMGVAHQLLPDDLRLLVVGLGGTTQTLGQINIGWDPPRVMDELELRSGQLREARAWLAEDVCSRRS